VKAFLAAVRFLTIVPVPARWAGGPRELARSVAFFPFVGLLIGIAAGALAVGLQQVLPALPAGVLLILALVAASGALHLDGLSDTADGFLSSRPRELVLEIMRDSRVGAMGVAAIVFVLALKLSAFASLPTGAWWRTALLVPVVGRCALAWTMLLLPYARPEGGLGSAFYGGGRAMAPLVALVTACAVGWWALGMAGLAAVAGGVILTLLLAVWSRRRIGGATGDTLGATCELVEAAVVLVLAGCYHHMWGADWFNL